jgi:hypothetical protein
MSIKNKNINNLNIGFIYSYEKINYLIIRSDYEKSKGYEMTDIDDLTSVIPNSIKNFYNEDVKLHATPKLTSAKAEKLKIGDFIIQDGLIYQLSEKNSEECIFIDHPKSHCPIYFYTPVKSLVFCLEKYELESEKPTLPTLVEGLEENAKPEQSDQTEQILEVVELVK